MKRFAPNRACVAILYSLLGLAACSSTTSDATGGGGATAGMSGDASGSGGAPAGGGVEPGGASATAGTGSPGAAGALAGGASGATWGQAGNAGSESGTGGTGGSSASSAGAAQGGSAGAADNPPPPLSGTHVDGTVQVNHGSTMGALPAGFVGFSFEKSHLTDGFFSPTHAALIAMFKLLGPSVVRIGADDVNNSVWVPSATFVQPGTTSPSVGTAEIDALAAFLTATGWKTIYAVNMRGNSTPQTAVTELEYVVPKLGASLIGVEIGNELNLYNLSNVETVWHSYAQAIHTAFPNTPIAGPGAYLDINFATKFINGEGSLINLVTHHYYRAAAGTSTATLANLVSPDPNVVSESQALANAVRTNKIRDGYRWGELNTYSSHGQVGMSDALVSALWGINFMLTTAQYGSAGVNFHGGGQNMDGNNCPNGASSCDRPFRYSPLLEIDSKVTGAAPLFYGMLLVSQMGTGDMLPTTVSAGSTKLRGYALAATDGTRVVLVNSEASTGVNATVDLGTAVSSASAIYLRGPSLTSATGTTLGEVAVSPAGVWTPHAPFTLAHQGTTLSVPVPAASAVLITVH